MALKQELDVQKVNDLKVTQDGLRSGMNGLNETLNKGNNFTSFRMKSCTSILHRTIRLMRY